MPGLVQRNNGAEGAGPEALAALRHVRVPTIPCHPRGTAAGCHTASDWRRQAQSTSLGLGHHRAAPVWEEAREGGLLGLHQALHVKQGAVQTNNNRLIMLGLSGINIPLDYTTGTWQSSP